MIIDILIFYWHNVKKTGVKVDKNKISDQLSVADAEKYLQSALGERDGYWRVYLQNNRRPERKPKHEVPYTVVRGRPFYSRSDLDALIAHVRTQDVYRGRATVRIQEALNALGGTATGRPFVASISPQIEEGKGIAFIQLVVSDPLLVFRLELDQALEVATELIEAVGVFERAFGERS